MYNIEELNDKLLSELKEIAEELKIKNFKRAAKQDLVYKILDEQAINPEPAKQVKSKEEKSNAVEAKQEEKPVETEAEAPEEAAVAEEPQDPAKQE